MSKLEVKPENHKIFIFKSIFEFDSAKQQAEKKKLNAFGLMAKLNPLKRPTDDNVTLKNHMFRYEPFWFVSSLRSLDFTCLNTYQVPVSNPYTTTVMLKSDSEIPIQYPVTRQQDKLRIDIQVVERCHRTIEYSNYFDGLNRDVKTHQLENYVKKFSTTEVEKVEIDNPLQPLLSLDSLTTKVRAELQNQMITASSIHDDHEEITALHLYFRPVYAFEYRWGDKIGILEVDGLTGEIVENGNWFKDTFDKTFTRENLIELSAELASTVVPGGGTVLKIASKAIKI
ncbi:hypothetical protein [Acinetobacter sp. MD2(2019)]|uniref:hypothetical protein n=1 Tax=Acinetobacter sp. MD2(2019) TaxID=2605273 RepID=UPI002D1EDC61|nr:hypothetical protein [Acinetobacter sp. MD2(2019)]MEB3754795.1 hypothetical protein [Acinetobacter sp. MD2(2019)]